MDQYQDWPPAPQDNGKKWSKAKLKILHILWPGDWVEGSEIFKAVEQTYYDRRIRELREAGWEIETHSSGSKYKLNSHVKALGNVRTYPSISEKKQVYTRDKGICQICKSEEENLQYDHKIPLDRLGTTSIDNLQLLCSACNVEKRGACKKCKLDTCEKCPYAFPELLDTRFVITLPAELLRLIKSEAADHNIPDKVLITKIIKEHFQKR